MGGGREGASCAASDAPETQGGGWEGGEVRSIKHACLQRWSIWVRVRVRVRVGVRLRVGVGVGVGIRKQALEEGIYLGWG